MAAEPRPRVAQVRVFYRGRRGVKLLYRPGKMSDRSVINEVLVKNVYAKKGLKLEHGTWLDAGAHIGTFSIACRLAGSPKVYAYEPHPENVSLLKANLAANGVDGVSVRRCAIVPERGRRHAQLHLKPHSTSFHSTYDAEVRGLPGPRLRVPARDILSVLEAHPDIDAVKLDIEGAEMPILELLGCPALRRIQQLIFEWDFKRDDDTSRLKAVKAKLERCGFRVHISDAAALFARRRYRRMWPSGVIVRAARKREEFRCPRCKPQPKRK